MASFDIVLVDRSCESAMILILCQCVLIFRRKNMLLYICCGVNFHCEDTQCQLMIMIVGY
jgi:hypothetical protein